MERIIREVHFAVHSVQIQEQLDTTYKSVQHRVVDSLPVSFELEDPRVVREQQGERRSKLRQVSFCNILPIDFVEVKPLKNPFILRFPSLCSCTTLWRKNWGSSGRARKLSNTRLKTILRN